MKCYFLIGLPGSGKSFITEKIVKENPDVVVLSMDNIIEDYAKTQNKTYREVWAEYIKTAEIVFEKTLIDAVCNQKDIIWDQTNLRSESRLPKIQRLLENKYQVEGIAVELSEQEWKSRIQHREQNGGKTMKPEVLEDMKKSYESPQYSEAFNSIYIVNDNNELALKVQETNVKSNLKAIRSNELSDIVKLSFKHNK